MSPLRPALLAGALLLGTASCAEVPDPRWEPARYGAQEPSPSPTEGADAAVAAAPAPLPEQATPPAPAAPDPAPAPPSSPSVAALAPRSAPIPVVEPTEIDVLLSAGPSRKSCKVSVPGGATLRWEASRGGLLENGRPVAGPRAAAEDGRGFTLDGTRYPGSLSATVAPGGALVLRNRVALDAYLEGVLAGELYPDAPPEALRAQAVLARSFALANLEGLTDDPMLHQAYRGVPPASSAALVRDAVRGTAGLRLLDAAGNPLPGYWYHSTCGGHTADAALVFGVPPSAACAGTACGKCGTSKYARWETEVTEREMRKALGFGSPVATLEVGSRSADGRVLAFRAATAAGTVRRVPAIDLRRALGPNRMRSTLVGEVEEVREPGGGAPRAFVLRGRGWGHGVGLCQIGACTLAREGRTAAEILALYFPGSRLVRAAR